MGEQSEEQPRETWRQLGPAWVRSLEFGPSADPWATVVLVPGLGMPSYTFGTARALSSLGLRCVVLDLLRGRSGSRVPPRVLPMGEATAAWVTQSAIEGPVVLMGHSTGAQVALTGALGLQAARHDLTLVLAGLTFRSAHRTVPGLLRGAATAYRQDSLRELAALRSLTRAGSDVVRLVRSGQRDRPEERVPGLRIPLVLTAGEADTFAPEAWMRTVAAASGSPTTGVSVLPGSHNNLFTHAADVAALVAAAVPVRGF